MKVALGTYEIEETDRKAIKKALGFRGGKASRIEVRDFLLTAVADKLSALENAGSTSDDEDNDDDGADEAEVAAEGTNDLEA